MTRLWTLLSVCNHHTGTTRLSLITFSEFFFFYLFFVVFSFLWLVLKTSGKRCVLSLTYALMVCFNSKHLALWLACFQNRACANLKWLVFHGVCFLVGWMLFTFRRISEGEWLYICFCADVKVAALGSLGEALWSGKQSDFLWLSKQQWFILSEICLFFRFHQMGWERSHAWSWLSPAGTGLGEGERGDLCRLGENGWLRSDQWVPNGDFYCKISVGKYGIFFTLIWFI